MVCYHYPEVFHDPGIWLDGPSKALIILAMFSGFGIFMMKQHISALPDEILEAAKELTGANEFYIFHKIVLPMSKNGIFSALRSSSSFGHGRISCRPYLVIKTKTNSFLPLVLRCLTDSIPQIMVHCLQ